MKIRKKGDAWVTKTEKAVVELDKGGFFAKTLTNIHENSYLSQLRRVQRCYNRLQQCINGKIKANVDDFLDYVYAFFLNCYHLKDWIINDPYFPTPTSILPTEERKRTVEGFIENHKELQICADICNAHKHFKLSSERSKEKPKVGQITQTSGISIKDNKVEIVPAEYNFSVNLTSGEMNGFDLAKRCLELWKDFIRENGGAI